MKKIIITIREFLTQAVIIHKVITHILYAYRKGYNIYTYGQLDRIGHVSSLFADWNHGSGFDGKLSTKAKRDLSESVALILMILGRAATIYTYSRLKSERLKMKALLW